MAYSPGPWTAQPPPEPSRAPLVVLVVSILVIGLLGGAITGFLLKRSDRGSGDSARTPPSSGSPSGESPVIPPPPSTTPTPTARPTATPTATPTPKPSKAELEQKARTELEQQSAEGLATADPRGQWVAQLSGKYIGITDPQQTNRSGGHTFRAVEILDDYTTTKTKAEKLDTTVVLIKGSTILKGRQETSGHLFWFVFALDFSSKAEVESFCAELYPSLSGTARTNQWYPTQLKP